MSSRFVLTAFAAATLCGAAPSFAQGSGLDPDRVGPGPQVQPPPVQAPSPKAQVPAQQSTPRADRHEQGPRDDRGRADRRPDDRRPDRRPDDRRNDRRHGDNRWPDRHSHGYVVPRPNFYYVPPPVYYAAPPVYYGGVPPAFYPYSGYSAAPLTFRPGDYLPPEYRQQQFVVNDWEWRGLSAPPYGYYWILLGPDNYALVLASTGQIVSLVAAR